MSIFDYEQFTVQTVIPVSEKDKAVSKSETAQKTETTNRVDK